MTTPDLTNFDVCKPGRYHGALAFLQMAVFVRQGHLVHAALVSPANARRTAFATFGWLFAIP